MEHEKCKLPHWIPKPLPNRRPAVSSIKDDTSFTKLRQVGEVNMSVTELRETFNKKKKTKNVEKLDQKKESLYKRMSGELHTQENDIKFNELLKERYKRVTGEFINPVLDDLPEWLFDEKNGNL